MVLPAALFAAALCATPSPAAPPSPSLAVLDPVDLADNHRMPRLGDTLRSGTRNGGRWQVPTRDSLTRRLRDLGIDPGDACREFQCAFDAGHALQTEFVLFGTASFLGDMYAFTLNLLHVPSAQVVWSEAGEGKPDGDGIYAALMGRLHRVARELDPSHLDLRRRPGRGMMAVLDLGDGSDFARAVNERAIARAYGARNFDLITPGELRELRKILDIRVPATDLPEQDMLALGHKMAVQYLLCTRVQQTQGQYRMRLALYDVEESRMIREWPTRATADLRKLLALEDRFFSGLGEKEVSVASLPPPRSRLRASGKVVAAGLAAAAGLGMGYFGYLARQDAGSEYRQFRAARSETEALDARQRVRERDAEAMRYGVLSGVSLALGVALWAF